MCVPGCPSPRWLAAGDSSHRVISAASAGGRHDRAGADPVAALRPALVLYSELDHCLATGLLIELEVGQVGLVDRPAVGEDEVHVYAVIGDEAGTIRLADI